MEAQPYRIFNGWQSIGDSSGIADIHGLRWLLMMVSDHRGGGSDPQAGMALIHIIEQSKSVH